MTVDRNPFEHNVWEGQRRLQPEDDVESLNHAASERILRQTEAVAHDRRARCLLVLGQPGMGKSHVLTRVLEQAINIAFPVVIRRYALPQATYRNLFRQITWGLHETWINGEWTLLDDLCFTPLQQVIAARRPAKGFDLDPELLGQATAQDAYGALRARLERSLLIEAAAAFEEVLRELLGDAVSPCALQRRSGARSVFALRSRCPKRRSRLPARPGHGNQTPSETERRENQIQERVEPPETDTQGRKRVARHSMRFT